jgi:hypothetical protein
MHTTIMEPADSSFADSSWLPVQTHYTPYSSSIPPAPRAQAAPNHEIADPPSIHDIPTLIPPPDYDEVTSS